MSADEKVQKLCSLIKDQHAYIIYLENHIKVLNLEIEATKEIVTKYSISQLKFQEVFKKFSLKKTNDIGAENIYSNDGASLNNLTSPPVTNILPSSSMEFEVSSSNGSNNSSNPSSSSSQNNGNNAAVSENIEPVLPRQRPTAALKTNADDFKVFDIIDNVETEKQKIRAKIYSKHAQATYSRRRRNKDNPLNGIRYYCLCKKGCSRNCGCRKRKQQCTYLCHPGTNCELKESDDSDPLGQNYIQIIYNNIKK